MEMSGFFETTQKDLLELIKEWSFKKEVTKKFNDKIESNYEKMYDASTKLSGFEFNNLAEHPLYKISGESSSGDLYEKPNAFRDVLYIELFEKGAYIGSGVTEISGTSTTSKILNESINSGVNGNEINGSTTY